MEHSEVIQGGTSVSREAGRKRETDQEGEQNAENRPRCSPKEAVAIFALKRGAGGVYFSAKAKVKSEILVSFLGDPNAHSNAMERSPEPLQHLRALNLLCCLLPVGFVRERPGSPATSSATRPKTATTGDETRSSGSTGAETRSSGSTGAETRSSGSTGVDSSGTNGARREIFRTGGRWRGVVPPDRSTSSLHSG